MDELKKAIRETKNYANRYGQKLNNGQLFLRLISGKVYRPEMIEKQKIKCQKDEEWQKKYAFAKKLIDEHLSKMKGIEMVGISGSVAAEAAGKNEDIDLLIVTREEELWWWRLFLRFYIRWHNIPHRRFGERERENEFCFNLWLDRANLKIPPEKRNLKNATDLVMMKIILDKNGCYQEFLRENKWVKKYLATGFKQLFRKSTDKQIRSTNVWKKIGNWIIFGGQYLYMQSKQKEKLKNIKRGQAFFHEND